MLLNGAMSKNINISSTQEPIHAHKNVNSQMFRSINMFSVDVSFVLFLRHTKAVALMAIVRLIDLNCVNIGDIDVKNQIIC